jgi:hypothetical protein
MTEQSEITVTFKIVELLHIHDQLLIAYDYGDDKKLIDYLMDRITEQIPDFEESENFPKLLIP